MRYALFPFTDQYQLLENRVLKDGLIDYVIPLKSWYDKVSKEINQYKDIKLLDFSNNVRLYDCLIVLPIDNNFYDEIISDFIYKNLELNIKVYNFYKFKSEDFNTILHENYINMNNTRINLSFDKYQKPRLNKSIIFNATTVKGYYHFETDSLLYNYFSSKGVSVCVVSCCPIANLYGFERFPIEELYKCNLIDAGAWILQYIAQLEDLYNPDIFIISMPESVNPRFLSKSSECIANFVLSYYVNPDYTILNVYGSNLIESENLIKLAEKFFIRPIDMGIFTDIVFGYNGNQDENGSYFRAENGEFASIYKKKIKENNSSQRKIIKKDDYLLLIKDVLNKLTKNNRGKVYEEYY